jgi:hypothetical protein
MKWWQAPDLLSKNLLPSRRCRPSSLVGASLPKTEGGEMPAAYGSGTLKQIQHLLDEGTFTGLSDARLLERFVTRRDEAAFAALVERHGAMVRNTCRAVLKDPNAADDAFQATFVLLFR